MLLVYCFLGCESKLECERPGGYEAWPLTCVDCSVPARFSSNGRGVVEIAARFRAVLASFAVVVVQLPTTIVVVTRSPTGTGANEVVLPRRGIWTRGFGLISHDSLLGLVFALRGERLFEDSFVHTLHKNPHLNFPPYAIFENKKTALSSGGKII